MIHESVDVCYKYIALTSKLEPQNCEQTGGLDRQGPNRLQSAKGLIRGRGMSELLRLAGEGPFRPPLDVLDPINHLALSDLDFRAEC